MTTAYDTLIASSTPYFAVLVEPQPMERLSVWTAAGGGLTNTWYTSFSLVTATDIVAGGIYRRLDEVRQNATALTIRASAALVDANLGSYFHDTTTDRLYVSIAGGLHPDTAALVGAWFTVFFSTTSVTFSDQPLYLPIVSGELPTLVSEMPDPLFGASVSDAGAVSLSNGDALFDRLSRRWVWRNKKVTIRLGGVSLAFSDFTTVAVLLINQIAVNDEVAVMQLESMGSILNRSIPTRTFGDFIDDPLIPESSTSLSQPLLFGAMGDCRLTLSRQNLVGTYYDAYAYVDALAQLAGATTTAAYAVNRVTGVRTLLVEATEYVTTSLGLLMVAPATYPSADYEIHADLTDLYFNAGVYGTNTFGRFARQLLVRAGEDASRINVAAFDAADIAAPQVLGLYLTEPEILADVLRRLEQSVGGQVYVGSDGLWTARVLDVDAPADYALTDADFVVWEPTDDLAAVLNEVRIQAVFTHATGGALEATSSDDTVRYSSETTDTHRIPTYLRSLDDATALAQRLRFLSSAPAAAIQFEERGLTLMGAQVGDTVSVTRARAPNARAGRYDGQVLRLTQIEKSLSGPSVRGILSDIGGRADRIFRVIEDGTDLSWSAATDAQRAVYGFLADADGYIDSTDAQTKDLKVVW